MNRYIGDTPFSDLLPSSISGDDKVQAAAEALDAVLKTSLAAIPDVLLMSRLAHDAGACGDDDLIPPMYRLGRLKGGLAALPEDVLDLLAWQLHVDGYELANGIEAKRRMVWTSLLIHRKAGTKWAPLHALENALLFSDSMLTITEWFEYGGDPYFFRVYLDLSSGYAMSDDTFWDSFFSLLHATKNVRSWLEYVETTATVGGATILRGTGLADRTTAQIYMISRLPEAPTAPLAIGAGAMTHTLTIIGAING